MSNAIADVMSTHDSHTSVIGQVRKLSTRFQNQVSQKKKKLGKDRGKEGGAAHGTESTVGMGPRSWG